MKEGKLFEQIMVENSPSLVKHIHLQILKVQQISNSINSKKTMLGYITSKLLKIKG